MKQIFILFIFLWVYSGVNGQEAGFLKIFDSSVFEGGEFEDIVVYNDTLVFYGLGIDSLHNYGIRFQKIDSFGNILLSKIILDSNHILTTSSNEKKCIVRTNDGGFAIIGGAIGLNGNPDASFFLRLNDTFEVMSLEYYDLPYYAANAYLIEVDDGFFTLWSIQQSNSSIAFDILIIRVDKNGQEKWRKQYGEYEFSEYGDYISELNSNEIVISGGFGPYPAFTDPAWPNSPWAHGFMMAIDSSGNELWKWEAEPDDFGFIRKFFLLQDSSWLLSGSNYAYISSNGSYLRKPMISKRDKNMEEQWEHRLGLYGMVNTVEDMELTLDGGVLLTGNANLLDYPAFSLGFHYKYNLDGDSIWGRRDSVYNGEDFTMLLGTEVLSSGSSITVGFADNSSLGSVGIIIKLTPDGCRDTLNCFLVHNDYVRVSDGNSIAYPNPVFSTVQFKFSDKVLSVDLQLFDYLGRVVLSQKIDRYQHVDVSYLTKGFYVYRLADSHGRLVGVGKLVKE